MHRRCLPGVTLAFLSLAALPILPRVAGAQATVKTPVELQETNILGFGARALGMGNAQVGVGDDASAIFFNPAGLAQLSRPQMIGGLTHDVLQRTTVHYGTSIVNDDHTRLGEAALAIPLGPYDRMHQSSMVTMAFGYHRWANLDDVSGREGLLVAPSSTTPGLYEFETYARRGSVDAWSAAIGIGVTPDISIGGSVRLLTGNSTEEFTLANYRAQDVGGTLVLDVGDPTNPDPRAFEQIISRNADAWGVTGSLGFLAKMGFLRLGGVVDLPASLTWEGDAATRLEDTEKIDTNAYHFHDDLTLPLSLSGGASIKTKRLLVSGGVKWTDDEHINFEGQILAPPNGTSLLPQPAYRSVLAWNAGAEFSFVVIPLQVRAGYYTEPVPYKLIAADPSFTFVPDDGDPNTTNDASVVARDYPEAALVTDRSFFTLGAGLTLDKVFSIDAAYAWGFEDWERTTAPGYENTTTFYPTKPVTEKVAQTRYLLSATVRFQ
jgi:hypothetical protein